MKKRKLKVALAGFGVVGKRRYECLKNHQFFRVVAVADKNFSDSCYKLDGLLTYSDYVDLFALDIDVLFVSLPNDAAPDATRLGIKNGLHVFCEKPPGRSVGDIESVAIFNKKQKGLKVKYGFNHRYHESVKDAFKIINSGEMGRVINLRGVYGKSEFIPWPRPSNDALLKAGAEHWRTSRKISGGGILLDQGIHMVDLMRFFSSDFDEVKSFISNSFWNHDVEDNAYAIMRSKDNVVAMLHSTATQWRHNFSLDIHLERGALLLSGILSGSKSYGDERLTIIHREENVGGSPRENSIKYIKDNSWQEEIDDFAADIAEDRPVSNGSIEDALATMKLVFKIYDSDAKWQFCDT